MCFILFIAERLLTYSEAADICHHRELFRLSQQILSKVNIFILHTSFSAKFV